MIGTSRAWNKTKLDLDIEMKEFWEQLEKIPKLESEGVKTKVKNNMYPMKKLNDDKKIEQQQSKVWDLGEFQVTTLER